MLAFARFGKLCDTRLVTTRGLLFPITEVGGDLLQKAMYFRGCVGYSGASFREPEAASEAERLLKNQAWRQLMRSILLAVLLLGGSALAQNDLLVASQLPEAPSSHRFWTTEKKVEFSALAGLIAADGITTQRGLSQGYREANPVMRPLVTKGAAGQAAASALGFGAALGTSYLLHATHHYKAERIVVRSMLAIESGFVANNLMRLY